MLTQTSSALVRLGRSSCSFLSQRKNSHLRCRWIGPIVLWREPRWLSLTSGRLRAPSAKRAGRGMLTSRVGFSAWGEWRRWSLCMPVGWGDRTQAQLWSESSLSPTCCSGLQEFRQFSRKGGQTSAQLVRHCCSLSSRCSCSAATAVSPSFPLSRHSRFVSALASCWGVQLLMALCIRQELWYFFRYTLWSVLEEQPKHWYPAFKRSL